MHRSHLHQENRSKRGHTVIVTLVIAVAVAILLYAHGSAWWYAPLALVGIIVAHIVIFGGLTFALTRAGRLQRDQASDHSHEGGIQLHSPRLYDVQARVCTLGHEKKLRQWTLALADVQPGKKVLDVGCGTGTLLIAAAERAGRKGDFHGVEPSAEMRAHAEQKAHEQGIQLNVVDGSADHLPYPSGSFDAVFCTLAFHHLPPSIRKDSIREMRRVLRAGGVAVIVDWQRPKSFLRALASTVFLVYLVHSFAPRDAQLDEAGISAQMKELGFNDISTQSFGPGGIIGAVVGRLAP